MKVALITGAASGIGLALSQIHLKRGDQVVLIDKDQAKLSTIAQELSTEFPKQVIDLACDVSNSQEVNTLAQHLSTRVDRIDWLYNNAGIMGNLAPIWELEPESIQQVMNVNLYGMIYMIQAFTPLLLKQNHRSQIINMASMYALYSGSQIGAYAMSKHAVLALSESLHYDFQRLNHPVDVSIVFPSFTDTSLLSKPASNTNPLQETLKKLLTHSRPAEDVAQHVVQAVDDRRFYILPDKEVKAYLEERSKAILMQEEPHLNAIEKLMGSLVRKLA